MPFTHISTGGYSGTAHSRNFAICDQEMAYVMPVKVMAMTTIDLLWDGAKQAVEIKANYTPKFNKESYIEFLRNFKCNASP